MNREITNIELIEVQRQGQQDESAYLLPSPGRLLDHVTVEVVEVEVAVESSSSV